LAGTIVSAEVVSSCLEVLEWALVLAKVAPEIKIACWLLLFSPEGDVADELLRAPAR